jgi:hypothetical protein
MAENGTKPWPESDPEGLFDAFSAGKSVFAAFFDIENQL